jgi:hypothetical protein
MKNDNKLVKFTIFVLLVALITLVILSGTYAKYTSTVAGDDTATVAKWSIEVNDNEITTAEDSKVTFDLFDTIKDSNGTDTETDVAESLIAPGTSGSFDLKVANTSEVTAKYSISFTVTNTSSIPIQYSVDGGSTWTTSLSTVSVDKLAIGANNTTTVQWKWAYENGSDASAIATNDTADTKIGTDSATSAATIKVAATIAVTQVD